MRLKDKVALVTGGGSGIGHATAVLFAAKGAKVVVSDLNEANALETVAEIKNGGGDATADYAGDVSKNTDAEAMVKGTVETYGTLDIVVNCAGVVAGKALPAGASPEEVWDRVMDVNLKGTYLVTWHAVRAMEQSGGGSIINIASINGLVGYPMGLGGGFDAYVPSKGACGPVHQKLGYRLRQEEHPCELHLPRSHRHQSDSGSLSKTQSGVNGWSSVTRWVRNRALPKRSPTRHFFWHRMNPLL